MKRTLWLSCILLALLLGGAGVIRHAIHSPMQSPEEKNVAVAASNTRAPKSRSVRGGATSEAPADVDSIVAFEVMATLAEDDQQQVAAGHFARLLAQKNPISAFAWAQTLKDDAARLRAIREVLQIWAEADPIAASRSIVVLRSEREHTLAALAVASTWARLDAPAALAWSESHHSTEARALLLPSAIQTWADYDAAAAMRWMANRSPAQIEGLGFSTKLAILDRWAMQDPMAAQDFVTSLPPDEQASAIETIAPKLAQADPHGTMLWALSLKNNELCETVFARAFRRWSDLAPAEAQKWLQTADLTPAEKNRLVDYP